MINLKVLLKISCYLNWRWKGISKFDVLYKELQYVCRVSPVTGIIGIRSLVEGILNTIIVNRGYLEKEECEVGRLGRKLELLKGKGILSERQVHFISDVIYRGNDAAHLLKGSESEAKSLYISLEENYPVLIKLLEEDHRISEKERRIGKIVDLKTRKNIGYIEDNESGERYIFAIKELEGVNQIEPQLGEELTFDLEENYNKSKAEYKAVNIMYTGKVGLILRKEGRSYSFIKSGERAEDVYLNISYLDSDLKKELVNGSRVEFKVIQGANKNEASEVRLVS